MEDLGSRESEELGLKGKTEPECGVQMLGVLSGKGTMSLRQGEGWAGVGGKGKGTEHKEPT